MLKRNPALKTRTSEHRVAGIALFRALLGACKALPGIENTSREALQNIVRNRFKRHKYVHSRRLLQKAFVAGYAAVKILRSSATSETSREQISHALNSVNPRQTAPPRLTPKQAVLERRAKARVTPGPHPTPFECTIWARPRPVVKGIRRIPKLVVTNGFPFLRVGKPQPRRLSMQILKYYQRTANDVENRDRLRDLLPIAEAEDLWDQQIGEQLREQRRAIKEAQTKKRVEQTREEETLKQGAQGGVLAALRESLHASSTTSAARKTKQKDQHELEFEWIDPVRNDLESLLQQAYNVASTSWQGALFAGLFDLQVQFSRKMQEKKKLCNKMLEIIKMEKALARKEKKQRKQAVAAASSLTASPTLIGSSLADSNTSAAYDAQSGLNLPSNSKDSKGSPTSHLHARGGQSSKTLSRSDLDATGLDPKGPTYNRSQLRPGGAWKIISS